MIIPDIRKKIAVFIHLYYHDTVNNLFRNLRHFIEKIDAQVFLNIDFQNPNLNRICKVIENRYPSIIVIKTSNVGKDIGAKLALMQAYLNLNFHSDYMLFIHDKKSPQLVHGESWQNILFKICKPSVVNQIDKLFADSEVGMIGRKENFYSKRNDTEKGIFSGNKELTIRLSAKYGLNSDNYDFIGGTMFWVRSTIYEDFFKRYNPLSIRETLEKGNVMDDYGPTNTHSWERLLGWIVTSNGYKIKTL